MATQTVEFLAVYGQSLTAKLYAVGSDVLAQTASAVTEQANRVGVYRATFTDVAAGEYELHAYLTAGTVPVARWYVTLSLTTATFATYDGPAKMAAITHTGARIPNVTLVDTTTVNSDMRGTDGAALASEWTATRAGYLDGVLLATNYNIREVSVTGSHHIAADIHELQDGVINSTHFAADWFTAAGLAASAVTEIQAGLATSAAQTTAQSDLNDIQSRLPAALVAGRMDASVGVMQADTVTAAALAVDAVTEIQSGLSTLTDLQVKAQIIEALSVDILAEISTIPGASSTLTDRIGLLFALARNKLTQTSSLQTVFADNGSTTIGTATVADNGTTFTRDKLS